jgi:hypothetical protein
MSSSYGVATERSGVKKEATEHNAAEMRAMTESVDESKESTKAEVWL